MLAYEKLVVLRQCSSTTATYYEYSENSVKESSPDRIVDDEEDSENMVELSEVETSENLN